MPALAEQRSLVRDHIKKGASVVENERTESPPPTNNAYK
jgi:hypothetical protein